MNQRIKLIILAALLPLAIFAEVPARVSALAAKIKAAPALKVEFRTNGRPSQLLMDANGRFAIDMDGMQIFFDGKTQWSYSPADAELTIFEPTPEELAQGNPVQILATLDSQFSGVTLGNNVRLTPLRPDTDPAEVTLRFSPTEQWPLAMTLAGQSGTVEITDMVFTPLKTKQPDSAFKFRAPKGVKYTTVDLR